MNRFLLTILGPSSGIESDLNYIADSEHGVNYVEGKGIFICTFYSINSLAEIQESLSHRPAIMIFDISNPETFGVNLPTKYYMGIFPEVQKTMESIQENWEPERKTRRKKEKVIEKKIEEFDSVDEILDKLSRHNYDRSCLTEKELEVLQNGQRF